MMVLLGLSYVTALTICFFSGYFLIHGLLLLMKEEPNLVLQILGGSGTLAGTLISFYLNRRDYNYDN